MTSACLSGIFEQLTMVLMASEQRQSTTVFFDLIIVDDIIWTVCYSKLHDA